VRVQGTFYELGSTESCRRAGVELGLLNPDDRHQKAPLTWGRFRIRDDSTLFAAPSMSATDIVVRYSNVGTGRIAMQIGGERQRAFLTSLGLAVLPVELSEARWCAAIAEKLVRNQHRDDQLRARYFPTLPASGRRLMIPC
jgi:cell division protein FtsI (penicillin-binding protein 3)